MMKKLILTLVVVLTPIIISATNYRTTLTKTQTIHLADYIRYFITELNSIELDSNYDTTNVGNKLIKTYITNIATDLTQLLNLPQEFPSYDLAADLINNVHIKDNKNNVNEIIANFIKHKL